MNFSIVILFNEQRETVIFLEGGGRKGQDRTLLAFPRSWHRVSVIVLRHLRQLKPDRCHHATLQLIEPMRSS